MDHIKKSCKYCGGIHQVGTICPRKPKKAERRNATEEDRFRWTNIWKKKREQIKQRDWYLCQVCIRGAYNTIQLVTTNNLQVHHIVPLTERYDMRLANDNLITLCPYHHRMAETGEIPKEYLQSIVGKIPPTFSRDK